jgi:hypothetical protein
MKSRFFNAPVHCRCRAFAEVKFFKGKISKLRLKFPGFYHDTIAVQTLQGLRHRLASAVEVTLLHSDNDVLGNLSRHITMRPFPTGGLLAQEGVFSQ